MWWMMGIGFAAWFIINWACEGPHIPAAQARNNYKLMNAVLVFLMVWMAVKAHGWHIELMTLISQTR